MKRHLSDAEYIPKIRQLQLFSRVLGEGDTLLGVCSRAPVAGTLAKKGMRQPQDLAVDSGLYSYAPANGGVSCVPRAVILEGIRVKQAQLKSEKSLSPAQGGEIWEARVMHVVVMQAQRGRSGRAQRAAGARRKQLRKKSTFLQPFCIREVADH